ncbi:MAG: hypothetical protein ACXWW0_03755 [Bacteroidia bacterium]
MGFVRRLPLFEQFITERIYTFPNLQNPSPKAFADQLILILSGHYYTRAFKFIVYPSEDSKYIRLEVVDTKTDKYFYIGVGADGYQDKGLGHIDFYADSTIPGDYIDIDLLLKAIEMDYALETESITVEGDVVPRPRRF